MKTQKTWLITGASRGFGLDISKAVLASGDQVVATVRRDPHLLYAQLNNDRNLQVVTMDVTDEQQVSSAVDEAIAKFGRIDVLVNNAGYGLLSAVEEATDEEIKNNYEVNVFGTLKVIRTVLPFMRRLGSGHIINISSIGGLAGHYGWGIYGSTKFAIEGLTESLAAEVAPLGIFATVVAPGAFRTNFMDESSLATSKKVISDYAETVGAMREYVVKFNYHQPGDPQKLAEAFVKIANAVKPPVHLPLGKDTLLRYREKVNAFEQDIVDWYDTITGTDHDDV